MRCLLFAYSEIGAVAFETLLRLGEEIAGVVTHEDRPGETRWWRSVREMAQARGIPIVAPENPNAPETLAWGRNLAPDIVFSFYYRQMLKRPWLELARLGAFNLHGSLLPKFRGRAPVNWAIIEGARETGLTLHEMIERADAGRIVDQAAVPIDEADTARDVFEKLVRQVPPLLERSIPLLREGRAPRRAQNDAEATYFGARTPAHGELDWRWPASRVHNMVRALTKPYPGAFAFLRGRKIFLWKGRVLFERIDGERPGDILPATPAGVPVACGEGSAYLVEEAQAEDQREPARGPRALPGGLNFDPYTQTAQRLQQPSRSR